MSSSLSNSIPSVSSRIQTTLDPCVVLMKELIGRYAHLWESRGGIFSLAQGVVHWKPPESVHSALIQALQDDRDRSSSTEAPMLHAYGPAEGLPSLRSALQEKLKRENGLTNHHVMITVGANQAYVNCILTLVGPNQKVVVFSPYYFNHVMAIQMALPPDALLVGPCSEDGIPDLQWLDETLTADPTIQLVTLTNPGNPTGVALRRSVLQNAVDLCRRHDAWLILDCTYEYFVHRPSMDEYRLGGCFPDPHVVHIFSFSKSYSLAGYRCGYIAVHQDSGVLSQMLKVQDTIPIAPSRIGQVAALAALRDGPEWVGRQMETLGVGRRAIMEALRVLQGPIMGGTGAMYIMAKLPSNDDREIAERLVRDFGVAVIPGSFCGFPGWIRVCYSNLPPENCVLAARRLEEGLRELCG